MGPEASAVDVAALPVVLLEIVTGRSAGARARNVGVAAGPDPGPARTLLTAWVRSCGVSVPLEVTGEPETAELKIIPSPVIPTLVTVPVTVAPPEVNMVRTSVTEEMTVVVVTTFAIGMVAGVNPVVFEAGAQLCAVSR